MVFAPKVQNRHPQFQRVKAPDKSELEKLVQLISQRVGRCLERQGLLEQDTESACLERMAKTNGFSLLAGASCEEHQKDKRAYIARPAVAVARLSLSSTGKVLYTLKTPYRDGTRACPALSVMYWAQRLKRVFNLPLMVSLVFALQPRVIP